jgi:hypothetical protein
MTCCALGGYAWPEEKLQVLYITDTLLKIMANYSEATAGTGFNVPAAACMSVRALALDLRNVEMLILTAITESQHNADDSQLLDELLQEIHQLRSEVSDLPLPDWVCISVYKESNDLDELHENTHNWLRAKGRRKASAAIVRGAHPDLFDELVKLYMEVLGDPKHVAAEEIVVRALNQVYIEEHHPRMSRRSLRYSVFVQPSTGVDAALGTLARSLRNQRGPFSSIIHDIDMAVRSQ